MKKSANILLALALAILFLHCDKQDDPFIYPSMGNHGPNLLYPGDTVKVSVGEIYSLCVEILEDPIEVHIKNLNAKIDTMQWGYYNNSINGWNISIFDTNMHYQKLNNSKISHIDAGIVFKATGCFKLEIFEKKSELPVRSTIITGL